MWYHIEMNVRQFTNILLEPAETSLSMNGEESTSYDPQQLDLVYLITNNDTTFLFNSTHD